MKTISKIKPQGKTAVFIRNTAQQVRNRWESIVVLSILLLVLVVIAFFVTATKDTVASYALLDYEIGQIADKTIFAEQTLAATEENAAFVVKGDKVIRKGFPITEDEYAKLKLLSETPQYIDYTSYFSTLIFICMLAVLSFSLFSATMLGRYLTPHEMIFLGTLFIINYALTAFMGKIAVFSMPFTFPIIIPAAFSIILVVVLLGQNTAVYFSFILSLGVLCAASFSLVPSLFVLFSCFFAVRISRKMEKRIDLVYVSLFLAALNVLLLLLFRVVFPTVAVPMLFCVVGFATNGFLSGILALGFLTPLEIVMNTASVFRLMDLSDLNSPIMKRMLLTAPGTYNHAMLVATLAESACGTIGANPLLARVGAYYHDIGKLEQPEYFVENQTGGNKHDEINPRLSASVIKRHVKKGVEKARQLRLPDAVIDIISQHHGNGLIAYFYNEAKKLDEQVSPEEFSYLGDPPSSKESAVVMLADTVEAACRTLDKPSVPRLQKFIRQLVMNKYEHHQLDKSNLTFSELDIIQEIFVNTLAGYYHSRIEYQNQKDPDEADDKKDEE